MAMASLLNSLTTKTSIHTTIRLEAIDAEAFFFTDQATPRQLEMHFAEVRGRMKAAARTPSLATPAVPSVDFAERLLRLGEMLDKGQISDEEFAIAKARLFDDAD